MFKIHFQILINVKKFKLMTTRQISFFQLRFNAQNHCQNKKTCEQIVPYLILTPQKANSQIHSVKNQRSERKNSFDRKSSFQAENTTRNQSQIDAQTNSFLTKPFLVKQVDHYLIIGQIIVFKGSFEVSANEILNAISPQNHHKKLLNKIYINCQLLLVSSYSTQSIGEWYGYSLSDEGSFALPIGFFSYNSSSVQASITFLWTSIELSNQSALKQLPANKVKQIDEFVTNKFQKLRENIINIPVQFQQKGSKHSQIQKTSDLSPVQSLISNINLFNQKIYPLWKKYQQYQQKSVQTPKLIQNEQAFERIFSQKLKSYERALIQYQWKNDIIVTEEIQPQQSLKQQSQCEIQNQEEMKQTLFKEEKRNKKMPAQLARLKKDNKVDDNLVFYPFSQHSRLVKLANEDFRKVASISSLSSKSNNNQSKDLSQRPHLIIFVHGYQASSFDMQTLANFFKFKQPHKIKIFLSACNQGRTQQPIEESGHRLAVEIKNFINNKFDYQDFDISFACHSMGGIIARAALKYLQLYKSKFKTFLSLCSPHLGYLYHSSALIKTSLWVLNQVKKDPSMIELTMQDHNELQKTFLYELSKRTELSWFKYPIFIGSRQDEYVPFWSALVRDKDFFFQTKQAKIYKMLYKNLGQNIQHKTIRLQAIYKDRVNDLSSFVGRTAHIRILNCIEVMQMIYLLIEKAF